MNINYYFWSFQKTLYHHFLLKKNADRLPKENKVDDEESLDVKYDVTKHCDTSVSFFCPCNVEKYMILGLSGYAITHKNLGKLSGYSNLSTRMLPTIVTSGGIGSLYTLFKMRVV